MIYAGSQEKQVLEVAPVQRKIRDFPTLNHLTGVHAMRLQYRSSRRYRNGIRHRAQRKA